MLLDLDGCLWVGDEPTARAVEAVAALRAAGKGLAFVTNDGRRADDDHVRKLWRLGFQASREEVVTVGAAIRFACAEERWQTAVVVGSEAIHDHVAGAGLRIRPAWNERARADVVVVAAHDDLRYAELRAAVQAVLSGADLLCAGPRRHLPDARRPVAGDRSDRRCGRGGDRRDRPQRRQARRPTSSAPRWTASARAARWRSATGRTRTSPRRVPRASTARSCSGAGAAGIQRPPTRPARASPPRSPTSCWADPRRCPPP